MGWGNGISIGWPNTSAQSVPPIMAYFTIDEVCGGSALGVTTQLVNSSIYSTGDYVDTLEGFRVKLGTETITPSIAFNIFGPVYTSCPV